MPQFPQLGDLPSIDSTEALYSLAMTSGAGSAIETPSPQEHPSPLNKAGRRKFSITIPSSAANGNPSSLKTSASALRTPDETAYSSDGTFGKAGRHRGLSTSSEQADISMLDLDQDGINPRKRSSTDTVDYPRRRATIACEICRGRKSRCDGAKPRCRLCTELNAECVYREPGIKLDAGDKLILERLGRIEGLLQSNLVASNDIVSQTKVISLAAGSPTLSNGTSAEPRPAEGHAPAQSQRRGHRRNMSIPITGLGTWMNASMQTNISTMPKVHTTPALHLLQWPMIRELVSRPYDPQHLLQLELAREPLVMGNSLSLDLANTGAYVHAFFERVNVWYACVNPYSWESCYRTAMSRAFREGPESCVTLLVFALGAAALSGSISNVPRDQEPPGMPYFSAAWSLLPSITTRNNTASAQCLILASAYLFYLVRPLEAWTLLSSTSMKLQLLLGGQGRIPNHAKELGERVFWNALLFESDLLAELDLPHSGIVQFEETVGLPGGFDDDEEDAPAGRDELWYFLAEIALRRLLNRVSHVIYSKGASTTLAALQPVVEELDFQLTQWYEGLPQALQFPYSRVPLSNPVQTVLRLRYFACRTIIFRPYILAVLENESAILDPVVRDNSHKCLEASVRQLEHITAHHAGHLPYLWQGALSIVSQTLLVMGATLTPSLSALLPPAEQMDGIINDVVVEIERYSHLAPSLRLSSEIVREAEERRMIMLRSAGMRL